MEVALSTAEHGLAKDCVLSLDNTETVPKGLLTERMTALTPERMAEVCTALAAATEC